MPNNRNQYPAKSAIFEPTSFHLAHLDLRSQTLVCTSRRVALHLDATHFQLAHLAIEINRLQRMFDAAKRNER